jgi:phosphotransferase system enzyme I (PtsI)
LLWKGRPKATVAVREVVLSLTRLHPLLAVVLAGLGVTSLSMAPPSLAEVRVALAGQTLARCEAAAAAALAAATPVAARAAARAGTEG